MFMHDIHPEQQAVVLLLHPMLASAQLMYSLLAEPMGSGFRYLIPDFSGHGEAAGESYQRAEQEARQIREYLREKHIRRLRLAFGVSMGGAVLMELLHDPGVQIERLFFEGASMYTHADLLYVLMKRVIIAKHRKARADHALTVQKMGELYGEQAKDCMAEQMIAISEESLANVAWDCSHVHLPELTEAQQKRCVFAYGEQDGDLKKAKVLCPRQYPCARLKVWPGRGHCMAITQDPAQYGAMLLAYMNGLEP